VPRDDASSPSASGSDALAKMAPSSDMDPMMNLHTSTETKRSPRAYSRPCRIASVGNAPVVVCETDGPLRRVCELDLDDVMVVQRLGHDVPHQVPHQETLGGIQWTTGG
jgi:hypothetical protein